ncbi:hypothetical protein PG994_009939 [Apiospora phragmitis]|uniref:FAD dependent oxidoreductase domain-containing protein n=1 Tax=Apiospora phragmitis TaxID=2905665 RepID=A0ABR1TNG4_9PEZI
MALNNGREAIVIVGWDRTGYQHLTKLAEQVGPESFVQQTPSTEYWEDKVSDDKMQSLSDYLQDLPDGVASGLKYTTVTINAPEHIKFLYRRLKDHHGVRFVRQKTADIHDAYISPQTEVVFNCTGTRRPTWPASRIPGATHEGADRPGESPRCPPERHEARAGLRDIYHPTTVFQRQCDLGWLYAERREVSCVRPHIKLVGTLVLTERGPSTSDTFSDETDSILKRTSELSSEVRNSHSEILAVLAGLRPSREGGARVEAVELKVRGQGRLLVHNYGAGGTGFQAGYGMAADAVASAKPILDRLFESCDSGQSVEHLQRQRFLVTCGFLLGAGRLAV